jgi:two-component system, LytTR family, response regulator
VQTLRVVIVDDERPARAKLRRYLAAEPDFDVIAEASGGLRGVEVIRVTHPDLVFLDVQMPDLDGFGVVEALAGDPAPYVVFVTAHDRYAVRAFEVHAFDYLLKPVGADRFAKVLERVRREVARKDGPALAERVARLVEDLRGVPRYAERILVTEGERGVPVDVDRIDRVEADRNYVTLHAGSDVYRLRGTLEGLERKLDPSKFVRVNRSTLVRIDSIKEVHPWFHGEYRVVLVDGTEVTWTRTHLDRAAEIFLKDF